MTNEEAVKILDPKTTKEALSGYTKEEAIAVVEEACRLACEALKAEPVRYGHWIPKKYMSRTPFASNYNCSLCGADPIGISDYCPNCGAMMEGCTNEKWLDR